MLCTAGIAHLLEHMAFKGSARVGSRDFKREAVLLEAVDEGMASQQAVLHAHPPAYKAFEDQTTGHPCACAG